MARRALEQFSRKPHERPVCAKPLLSQTWWMQLFHVSTSCPLQSQVEAFALGHRALAMKFGVREVMKALEFFYLAALCYWLFGQQMLPLHNHCMSLADVSYWKALVSSISSASNIGVPAWWDVKGCRHLVSTSGQVRELELTLVIIFGPV